MSDKGHNRRPHRPRQAVRESVYPDPGWDPYSRFLCGTPPELLGWGGWAGYPRDRTGPPRQAEAPAGLLTEQDLRFAVAWSRSLCDRNPLALGFLGHVVNFVYGEGAEWKAVLRTPSSSPAQDADGDGHPDPDPDVATVQAYLDEWRRHAAWGEGSARAALVDLDGDDETPPADRQFEAGLRAARDGEVFVLFGPGDASSDWLPWVRFGEPEQVREPAGETLPPEAPDGDWSWGVCTDPDDAERRRGYWLCDPANTALGRYYPAGRVVHHKLNVDATIKRGLPDFFCVREYLEDVRTLLRNMAKVAGTQAAIAFVTQHAPGVTETQVRSFIAANQDASQYRGPFPGANGTGGVQTASVNYADAGKHLNLSNGQQFTSGPVSTGATQFTAVEQAVLRAVGLRWGCPEYFSGDASNANFASTQVAGGPFERATKRRQKAAGAFEQAVAGRVIAYGVRSGRLTEAQARRVAVQVTFPSVAIADKLADTQRRQVMYSAKVISPQTWCQEEGLDPKVEQANWQAWGKLFPEPGQQSGAPPDAETDPAGELFGEDKTGLVKKQITDKNGDRRTVYVKVGDAAAHAAAKAKAVRDLIDGKLDASAAGPAYRVAKTVVHRAEQAMSVIMHRTQALAAQAARERGLPDEHVARVARLTAAIDFAASFAMSKGTAAATGGNALAGFAAGMLPSASVAYLAYSTARDPGATLRAAKKYLSGELAIHPTTGRHEAKDGDDREALLLKFFADAQDPDWAEAVLAAALDECDYDVGRAVAAAERVLAKQPGRPAGEG